METLAKTHIKTFYTAARLVKAIGEGIREGDNGPWVKQSQYHCFNCHTDFTVDHRMRSTYGLHGNEFGDTVVICPNCGKTHYDFLRSQTICDVDPHGEKRDEGVPTHMQLTVKETRDCIILNIWTSCLTLTEDRNLRTTQYEEFRFDVKHRRSTWSRKDSHKKILESHALGDPFSEACYVSKLWHLRSSNLSKQSDKEIRHVMKVIRDAVRRKWKTLHHYDIGALYVSFGQNWGRMLFPLTNIAYRLINPDTGNLPNWLSGSRTDKEVILGRLCFTEKDKVVYQDADRMRQSQNTIHAIGEAFGLPETPLIRRCLQQDIFAAPFIREVLTAMGGDQNLLLEAMDVIHYLGERDRWAYRAQYESYERFILADIRAIKEYRSGVEILRFLRRVARNFNRTYLHDVASMLLKMPKDIKEQAKKVKLKDLHDWLICKQKFVEARGYDLDVPEAVIRRLAMQMDQVKFYLPTNSKQLVKGSEIFHNCVRTYADRVLTNICQIAYMTDDRGKLVACLEVRGNKLVQAKLKYNKPVRQDAAVNGAIVDWCQRVGLTINTSDVRETRYPVPITGEVAV